MSQRFAVVAYGVAGEDAGSGDRAQQVQAANHFIRQALAGHGAQTLWAPAPDGGQVAFGPPAGAEAAVGLISEVRRWAGDAGVPLRVSAHHGPADPVEGTDGRPHLVGPTAALVGRLLDF